MAAASLREERLELADARRRWGENADPAAVIRWFATNAEVEYMAGCYGAALKDAGYARRLATDPATVARALRVIGCVQLERGDSDAAIASLRASGEVGAADLAFALAEAGRFEEAVGVCVGAPTDWARGRLVRARLRAGVTDSSAPIGEGKESFGWIQLRLAEAELLLASGDSTAAVEAAAALIDEMRNAGVRSQLGDALMVRARSLPGADRTAAEEAVRELALSLGSGRLLALLG
jgi:hypothetical protein